MRIAKTREQIPKMTTKSKRNGKVGRGLIFQIEFRQKTHSKVFPTFLEKSWPARSEVLLSGCWRGDGAMLDWLGGASGCLEGVF